MKQKQQQTKKPLALIISTIMLCSVPLLSHAESQTDDEIINTPNPDIVLNDTNSTETDWEICVDDGCNYVDGPNEGFNINMRDAGNANTDRRPFTIETGTRTDALRLKGNNIGMGTATPAEELHIFSPSFFSFPVLLSGNAAIRLESQNIFVGGGNGVWDINGGVGLFSVENAAGSKTPFKVSGGADTNSLFLGSGTKVGIGTTSPATTLHVRKTDAKLTVEDTNNATASAKLIELKKAGIPAFTLTNSTNGSSWDFTQRTNGNFTLSKAASGGFEMQITPTGDVLARGDVFARGIMLTSSRAAKTDFSEIKTSDVMKKLAQINVEEWRYKGADKKDRHISPMAEDFYSLFQLGPDNKHINPNDLASVAIIAAKALQSQSVLIKAENVALKKQLEEKTLALQISNRKLDDKTTSLKASNDKLQERLVSLEKLVTNLASGEGYLQGNAKKVALNQ